MQTIRNYWRIAPSALPADFASLQQEQLGQPVELLSRLRPGHGLVYGGWDDAEQVGRVTALGVCLETRADAARIDWREVRIVLKPLPAGRRYWKNQPFFGFANSVVSRYALADLFAERFPDMDNLVFASWQPASDVQRRLPAFATPGFVYLIRSPYGYKIGKTVSMKSRTRLFEVKLPFPISVEHFAYFEDYSQAERTLHDRFRAQHLEGEWFDLKPADIAYIKSFGRPGTAAEMRV